MGFENDVLVCNNVNFNANAAKPHLGQMTANGQLLIGSTAYPNIRANTLTAGAGVTITNGPGTITIALTGGGAATEHLTGNTGGQLNPDGSNNFNLLGTGSITIAGAGSTLTTQLTGLTNHAVLVGAGTATITNVGPTATSGQVLQSQGASADPAFSTATYPSTTTINQILFSSAANTVTGLTTANNGVLTTGTSGTPVITALASNGQLIIGSGSGAPTAATLTAGTGITITNAANSITIASTGGSAGQNSTLDFWDDFMYYSASNLVCGENNWKTNAAGAPTTVSGHPGIVVFGTASSAFVYKSADATSNNSIILGAGTLTITFFFKINSITTFQVSFGLTDAPGSGGDQANGVYFLGQNGVNSGNWIGKTANASTRSTANSSTAVGTGWTVGQIVVNAAATSVAFNIGSSLSGLTQIANSPLTTNIPTVGISPYFGVTTGGSGTVFLDLVTMTYALTSAR